MNNSRIGLKQMKNQSNVALFLILVYLVFIQPKIPESALKTVLDSTLMILMLLMIVEKSINLFRKFKGK